MAKHKDSDCAGKKPPSGAAGQASPNNKKRHEQPRKRGGDFARGVCEGAAEERVEILRPALPRRFETAIHARARDSGAGREVQTKAGLLEEACESHVFEHRDCDGAMAADFFVGVAANQDELAVGSGFGRGRIVHAREIEFVREAAVNEWDQGAFEKRLRELLGRIGNERGVEVMSVVECMARGAGKKDRIGVCEKEPIDGSGLCSDPERVIFADPTLWELGGSQDFQARNFGGKLREDFWRAVGGLVVNDDDFIDFGLGGETADSGLNVVFFVAGRNDG